MIDKYIRLNDRKDKNMKRFISGILLCTFLLNSFISDVYAESLSQTSLTKEETGVSSSDSFAIPSSSALQSTSSVENTSETKVSESTKKKSGNVSADATDTSNSTTQEKESSTSSEVISPSSETNTTTEESNKVDPKEDIEVGKQGTNHKKGTYVMHANGIVPRSAGIIQVYADAPNLPKKDFIDVSSWNGTISVADYQKIKSYGITGVSVKLTEGTSYINPFAQDQISNAKAAGLSVSAYHYSLYTSIQTAQAEAKYFAQAATSLGLSKSTIMFNDAEDPTLTNNGRNAQATSLAFNQQLKNLGFSNDALYIGRHWIDKNYIDPASFDMDRIWVAQYPYVPDQTMQWNNEYGAWQWSSLMYFPGITNYQNRAFDISMSYSSFFGISNTGPNLNNYYTTNPGKVIVKQDDRFYNDVNFTSPGKSVEKNTLVTIKSIQTTASGIPRLFTDQGYLTANKFYVVAAQSNIDDYFTINPKKVRLKVDDYFYADTTFKQRLNKVTKGTIVEVENLVYADSGVFRLKTKEGYLTANKSLVEEYQDFSQQYYTVNPVQVIIKVDDRFYKDVEFRIPSEQISAGTVLKILGVEKALNGVPRLKTKNGYVTANKNYVVKTVPTIANYYTKNPLKVVLKTDDYYYKDLDFTQRSEKLFKGEVIDVENIEYTNAGIPRLKTAKGYLTANKNYVVQLSQNIDKYFTENPHKVIMLVEDRYYSDMDFSSPGKIIKKGSIIEVMNLEYTSDGVPRFKTKNGYLTSNKKYVVAAGNVDNKYFATNPQKVKLLTDDFYYNDLDFRQRGKAIKNGTTIHVESIEYTLDGIPRLKVASGYVTANKWYVEKIE